MMNSFPKVSILFIILFANLSFSQESKTLTSTDSTVSISKSDSIYQLSQGEFISDSLMLRGNIYDPLFLIKGLVAGASISKKGGHPGVPHEMVIRGLSSVHFTNKPIYIIDGVIDADISLIHPSDIASIEVLNNISHTAQYGNLGGNGIVIVQTKDIQGKSILHLEYDNFISFDQVAKKHELLSASQFRTAQSEHAESSYGFPLFYDAEADVDYQDELFRNAMSHSHHFTASGKINNTKYLASVSYKNQDGVVLESDASLISGNFKISQTFLKNKLQIQANANISRQNINGIDEFDSQDILYQTYIHHPTDPVFHPDGSYYAVPRAFRYFNPVEMIHSISNTITNNQLLSRLNIDYTPTKNWTIHLNGNYRKYNTESEFYVPITSFNQWEEKEQNRYEFDNEFNMKARVSYQKTFAEAHHLNATASYSYRNHEVGFMRQLEDVPYHHLITNFIVNDTGKTFSEYNINSSLLRLQYNYKQRYFIEGGLSYNLLKATVTSSNDYYLNFTNLPSDFTPIKTIYPFITAAWKMSNESFLINNNILTNLVLSAGYGEAGKENNIYLLELNQDMNFEQSKEYHIKMDFGFWRNKITGNLTYYNRTSFNVFSMIPVSMPPSILPYNQDNSIEINNKGVELNIQALLIDKNNLKYYTSLSFSKNMNNVTEYFKNQTVWNSVGNYQSSEHKINLIAQDEALFSFYLAHLVSIYDEMMIFDRKGGGLTTTLNAAEKQVSGQIMPEIEIGWSNQLNIYKNFDLSFSFRYIKGHSMYNEARMHLSTINLYGLNALASEQNLEYFTPLASDYYLEDASFIRLDNIVFSYNIDLSANHPQRILNVFIGANNLITITDYSGLDPEVSYRTTRYGIDGTNIYPPIRSYFIGLKLNL